MGIFNSYTKEGKGVNANEEKPIRPLYFFEILFRKISKFFPLNMLYILLTAPLWIAIYFVIQVTFGGDVTTDPQILYQDICGGALVFSIAFTVFSFLTGPATAAITYVFKNFATETPIFIYSDFFEHYKKNYLQSFLIALLTGFFMVSTSLTFLMPNLNMLRIPSAIFLLLLVFVNYYAYSIIVMFEMKFIDILRNSLLFALAKLPLNLFLLIIIAVISYYAVMYSIIGGILAFVFLYAFCGFMVTFSVYPTIEKYMLDPAKENTPAISEDL